jgi:hypothetical protein
MSRARLIDIGGPNGVHLAATESRIERNDHHRARAKGRVQQRRILALEDAAGRLLSSPNSRISV